MQKNKLATMLRSFIYLSVINLFIGCSHGQEQDAQQSLLPSIDEQHETKSANKVDQAIELAIANQDFRLYVTSGRRVTFPGINNDELDHVKDRCGVKYLSNTGDVITSEQQRAERKSTIDFMARYNKKMLLLCDKN